MSERRDLEQNILIQPSWKLSCDLIFAKLSAFQTWGFHLFPRLWPIENVTCNNKPGSGDDGWEQSQWRSKQIKSRWWPCDVSNNCGNLGKCQKGANILQFWTDLNALAGFFWGQRSLGGFFAFAAGRAVWPWHSALSAYGCPAAAFEMQHARCCTMELGNIGSSQCIALPSAAGQHFERVCCPGGNDLFPWAMIGCAWQPLDEMQGIQQEQSNATTAIFCISKIFLLRDFVGVFYFLAIPKIILLNGWDSGGRRWDQNQDQFNLLLRNHLF